MLRFFLLTPCVLFSTALMLPSQQLVLPDYQYLCESTTQLANAGATTWWRGTGGRFQVIYEASHFTGKAAVSGAVTINRIMFRGEDGESNSGGQSWAGVIVQLGSTSLDNTNMSTTFATNLLPLTTTLGLPGVTAVTVLPSVGSTPNNYNIVIDLAAIGAAISFDPTSAQPNLLIDITMPTAATIPPVAGAVMAMQDALGVVAVVRGEGVSTATPLALTGTTSASPPVVGVEFAGGGGYPTLIPARNEFYGAACGGSPSTFYQDFLNGQAADLAGLTLTPDSVAVPTIYIVTGVAGAFDATKVNAAPNSIADDAVVTHPLGFTFNYPGGSTTTVKPCTNGYVWLDSTMTAADFTPTVAELLGTTVTLTARLMPFWFDFHAGYNTATHPNSGLHVKTEGVAGSQVCYVTWLNVSNFNTVAGGAVIGGHAVNNLQCVISEATGVVEFRYGSLPALANASGATSAALVGFTRGRIAGVGSANPQSRDLSLEVPFSTKVEVAGVNNMGQTAVATPTVGGAQYSGRMFGGQTLKWNANNVSGILGVQLLDIAPSQPGFMFPTITAPGCMLSVTPSTLLWEVFPLPPASVVGTVPLFIPHGLQGTEIFAQFVMLDGLFGGPDLISKASNALKHTIGLN